MAWTTPLTATANSTLTAAQYNTYCRDNFLMMEPALATGTIYAQATMCLFMTDTAAANSVIERPVGHYHVERSQTTTSTTYTDLATFGPSVQLTTGPAALVWFSAQMSNSTANAQVSVSVEVSGATTIAAGANEYELVSDGHTAANDNKKMMFKHFTTLTSGSNVFTMKYKVGSGTGTFHNRQLAVWAF